MKKIVVSVLAIMLLFTGCTGVPSKSNSIEKYNWELDIVQNAASYMVIASSEKSSFKNSNVLEMSANASKGTLRIKDLTNNQEYLFNYEEQETNPESTIYKITGGSQEGKAVVSKTSNGSKKTPTLYMTFGGYSLKFFGNN